MAASDEVTSVNSVELKLSADDPLLPLRPELSEDSEIRQLFKQFLVSSVDPDRQPLYSNRIPCASLSYRKH